MVLTTPNILLARRIPSIQLIDELDEEHPGGTIGFTSSIGAAHATRLIVVTGHWGGDTGRSLSSCSIIGTNGTIHESITGTQGSFIASRSVPTGTSGTISFTLSGGPGTAMISVYRIVNLRSNTLFDSDSSNIGDGEFLSVNVGEYGVVVAGATGAATGFGDLSGVTEDHFFGGDEMDASSGSVHHLSPQTGRQITIDDFPIKGATANMCVCSWR